MLRITVDVVPRGDERAKAVALQVEIENDGTGSLTHGNYTVRWKCSAEAKEGEFRLERRLRDHAAVCASALDVIAGRLRTSGG